MNRASPNGSHSVQLALAYSARASEDAVPGDQIPGVYRAFEKKISA